MAADVIDSRRPGNRQPTVPELSGGRAAAVPDPFRALGIVP